MKKKKKAGKKRNKLTAWSIDELFSVYVYSKRLLINELKYIVASYIADSSHLHICVCILDAMMIDISSICIGKRPIIMTLFIHLQRRISTVYRIVHMQASYSIPTPTQCPQSISTCDLCTRARQGYILYVSLSNFVWPFAAIGHFR